MKHSSRIDTANFSVRLEQLLQHLERLLPDPSQRPAFRKHMSLRPHAALRINRLLPIGARMAQRATTSWEAVPWCADAFVVPDDRVLGLSLEFALGAFYIQAKATTLAVEALAPKPGERVLDLAAAPGGKASHIAAYMNNTGLLVVNEPRARRLSSLVGNLNRCGVHNAVFTKTTGTLLARHFHNYFDRVLLDAPCSGDGILCKDDSMLAYWSPQDAAHKSQEQLGLLRAALHMLRPGGRLVYSTCSLSTEENEDVLCGLLRTYGKLVELEHVRGVETVHLHEAVAADYPRELDHVVRIWPHLHETEGAFVSSIRKTGPTSWNPAAEDVSSINLSSAEETNPESTATASEQRVRLEERWGFEMPVPDDHELVIEGRHLQLRPRSTSALRTIPYFVRAGMRVAGLHKNHAHLSHQAICLWGDRFENTTIDLEWPKVQSLFKGERAFLSAPVAHKGEALFRYCGMPLCRGLVETGGRALEGFLPKAIRSDRIATLLDNGSA